MMAVDSNFLDSPCLCTGPMVIGGVAETDGAVVENDGVVANGVDANGPVTVNLVAAADGRPRDCSIASQKQLELG